MLGDGVARCCDSLLPARRSRRVVEPPLRSSDCCSRGGVGAWSSHLYSTPQQLLLTRRSRRLVEPPLLYAPATAAHEEESARGRATSTLRPSNCCSRGGVGAWSSHLYSTPQQLLLTRRSRRVIEPPLRSSDCCSRGGVGA